MPDKKAAEQIWKALKDASDVMLVTRDADSMRARPMAVYASPTAGQIYFLTDARAHKDEEIQTDPRVCITLDEGDFYCSISGRAEISRDSVIINEIWDTTAEAWFDGKDDPNLRLLVITPEYAEYWDRPGSISSSLKTTFAAATGSRPDMGENKKVSM